MKRGFAGVMTVLLTGVFCGPASAQTLRLGNAGPSGSTSWKPIVRVPVAM